MKTRQTRDWLDEVFDYEATHPIAFASPRALVEAHLIARMDKLRRRRLANRQGQASRRHRRNGSAG